MPTLDKIITNIDTFLGRKLEDEQEKDKLVDELTSTVTDLVKHPTLPARKRLLALFKRFGIEEAIASSLVTSLSTGIEKAREKDFEIATEPINSLFFPLLRENMELLVARAKTSIPMMDQFPDQQVLEHIEEAAIPFAQLVGSNVAEALALQDPAGVFKGKILVQAILQGQKGDPIQIANLFSTISSEKRQQLISLIGDKITQAQQRYQERREGLLRAGNVHQWIYDRLRERHIPHATAQEIAPIIAYNFSTEELDAMDDKKFMKLVIDVISSVPTHTD